jgi:acyl-CoA dehydrogenase
MRFDDSERAAALGEGAREFMDEVVLPAERDLPGGTRASAELIADLREEARARGLFAPQVPEEYGGMGLSFGEVLPLFEQAGRSLLGAPALRVDAPDEGNMHLLEMAGTDRQRERWLQPLVDGELTSAFSMTEPIQGGGSDPKMLRTTAEKDDDEWVIDGHKWWTSQGSEADVLLVLARTDQEAHPYDGCSFFVVPTDTDGVEIIRDIPHLGDDVVAMSHAEISYNGVRVPEANLLGTLNDGFALAQRRLGPARLTHCMRFSGMADRALDVATAYASEREAFGEPLAEKQGLRFDVARARMRLHAARTMVRNAASRIAAGDEARVEVAATKVFTANVTQDVVDTAVQLCGGNGIGKDLPLADFYANVRTFRIVDGADEVHLRTIARDAFSDVDERELASVTRYGQPNA